MRKITQEIAQNEITQKMFSYAGLTTICTVVLKNGWHETGTSCCANPDDYNKELGEKYSLEDATNKVIEKLSFLEVQGASTKKQNTVIRNMPSGITGGKFPTDSIHNNPWINNTHPWNTIVRQPDQNNITLYGDITKQPRVTSSFSI